MILKLHNDNPSSAARAEQFGSERVLARLKALDSKARRKGVENLDPSKNELIGLGMEVNAEGRVTKNSYGVFHLAWLAAQRPKWGQQVKRELLEIEDRLRAAHGKKIRYLIWAGMGGSAEDKSMYNSTGLLAKGPKVYVLDSTDPAKLRAILADMTAKSKGSIREALKATLVVGMAMGMTSYEPVVNLDKMSRLFEKHRIDSRTNFIYMTLPDSLLDQFAAPRGYRRIELQLDNGNTTAGRHSGPLTRGSLYPLGLAGVDLEAWIQGACLDEAHIASAFRLAAFLDEQGRAGRDKVTLIPSEPLEGASLWTKQDFEESLGKNQELGIKILIGEPFRMRDYRPPQDPKQDRLFLIVGRAGEKALEPQKANLIRRAGYPAATLRLEKAAPLSTYMQFIHYAVFGLGWLRKMNFVTQPSVELYKSLANPLYQNSIFQGGIEKTAEWKRLVESPQQIKWKGGVTLHYDRLRVRAEIQDRNAASAYAALIKQLAVSGAVDYGELTFFGDTRYSGAGKKMRRTLDRAAGRVFRAGMKMPADVYEGPAMNHSYHEMVIGRGRCFSTVLLSRTADQLPEIGYTADYHRAQFLATQMALEQRARPVVAITVKDLSDASLKALDQFFASAAAALK